MKIKTRILTFVLLSFVITSSFLYTGCFWNDKETLTIFYNEVSCNEKNEQIQILLTIKNNWKYSVKLKAGDFSIETQSGSKAANYFGSGQFWQFTVDWSAKETSTVYIRFDLKPSTVISKNNIYYLGQKMEILTENTVKMKIG